MAENISDDDALLIKEILDAWPVAEKLKWDFLVKAIAERRLGRTWSRQALARHPDIYAAYDLKKKAQKVYRGSPLAAEEDRKSLPPELQAALGEIELLESEVARLKDENMRYKEKFIIWAHNAHLHNITEDMLYAPLIQPDRGKSKKDARPKTLAPGKTGKCLPFSRNPHKLNP